MIYDIWYVYAYIYIYIYASMVVIYMVSNLY